MVFAIPECIRHDLLRDSQFQIGDLFVGTISAIAEEEFYVIPTYTNDLEIPDNDFNQLASVWWIPSVYELFLIFNENFESFSRCARVPIEEGYDSYIHMQVLFIDTGKTIRIPIDELPFQYIFMIPECLEKIPSMAVKCSAQGIETGEQETSLSGFLANSLSRKFTFEVVDIKQKYLKVDIFPFDDELSNSVPEINEPDEVPEITEEEPEATEEADQPNGGVNRANMTEKQKEMWDAEPDEDTSDPQIATQGFKTVDDDRICKFFDPEIGGCWKGSRCRLRHVTTLTDGSCRDNVISLYDIGNFLDLPPLHTIINIEILTMVTANTFWCHYVNLKKTQEDYDTLIDMMNSDNEIESYTRLKKAPGIKQLVICKSNDGNFYRARVEAPINENEEFQALLVDFGESKLFTLENLFDWCPRFDFLPFQAVSIEIANVVPKEGSDEKVLTEIMKHIVAAGKTLKATVFDVFPQIKCTLFNSAGADLGEQLVNAGLADRVTTLPPMMYETIIPG